MRTLKLVLGSAITIAFSTGCMNSASDVASKKTSGVNYVGPYEPKIENQKSQCDSYEKGAMRFKNIRAEVKDKEQLQISFDLDSVHVKPGVRLYVAYVSSQMAGAKADSFQPMWQGETQTDADIAWRSFYPQYQWFTEILTDGGKNTYHGLRKCSETYESAKTGKVLSVCADPETSEGDNAGKKGEKDELIESKTIVFEESLSKLGLQNADKVFYALNGYYRSALGGCELETDAPEWESKQVFELSLKETAVSSGTAVDTSGGTTTESKTDEKAQQKN